MRVAIAARVVPPLRLQRLRLDDRLVYLAHDELAFTPEESAEAVRAAGLALDPARSTPSTERPAAGRPACEWRFWQRAGTAHDPMFRPTCDVIRRWLTTWRSRCSPLSP